jgi:hypothetical protein
MDIARLCFHRGIRSSYSSGTSISLQLSLNSEFSGVIPNLLKNCKIAARYVYVDGHSYSDTINYSCRINGDICIIKIVPPACSRMVLEFFCVEYPQDVRVLSLRSDEILLGESSDPKIICEVFRSLSYTDKFSQCHELIIKEDRGLTMGSHLWDSAIVIYHHFNYIMTSIGLDNNSLVGVELGAGCGLTAVQMAKYGMFSHVYCTDIRRQVALMEDNISLNGVSSLVTAHELDWCDNESLERIQTLLSTQIVDIIFAADVLYQPDIFGSLLAVIDTLAHPGHTAVFIAQKLRGERSAETVDVTKLSNYDSELVLSESNVLVWKLVRKLSI